jgi:hypothetical protein
MIAMLMFRSGSSFIVGAPSASPLLTSNISGRRRRFGNSRHILSLRAGAIATDFSPQDAAASSSNPTNSAASSTTPLWPCGDALDAKIGKLAVPAILNLLVIPLVGIVDMMWVGRMQNALAIAGMQAANQVFSSSFWIISFLPTVVAPLIAKAAASGDKEAMEDEVAQAVSLCVGVCVVVVVVVATKCGEYTALRLESNFDTHFACVSFCCLLL